MSHSSDGTGQSKRSRDHLYLVATPIGNLEDITLRALSTLKNVDKILCEDTRVSRKLLQAYDIRTPLVPYHEHNAEKMRPQILEMLKSGKHLALITDAGMPLISDPGYKLVRSCIEEDISFTVIPGASAPLNAVVLSGLPSHQFCFCGFAPQKEKAREDFFQQLKDLSQTLVLFESPRRLTETLHVAKDILGNRPAAVARELTKMFEEVRREPLESLHAYYHEQGAPRGEIVLVIDGQKSKPSEGIALDEQLLKALQKMSVKEAVDTVRGVTGLPRKVIYARALELKS